MNYEQSLESIPIKDRIKIINDYRDWRHTTVRGIELKDCPENFLAFLCVNNLINKTNLTTYLHGNENNHIMERFTNVV